MPVHPAPGGARNGGGGGRSLDLSGAIGAAIRPHLTEDNLDAMVIHPAPHGGWHADVVLQEVPPGIANAIGTPVGKPERTRGEAGKAGLAILSMVLRRRTPCPPPAIRPPPAFSLHGNDVPLLDSGYQALLGTYPDATEGYGSERAAPERLAGVLGELMPEGFTPGSWRMLPDAARCQIVAVVHVAALSGLLRYPPPGAATPSGHPAPSPIRH